MKLQGKQIETPRYRGRKWIEARLPDTGQLWVLGKHKSVRKEKGSHGALAAQLHKAVECVNWKWPKRTLFFFSDLHADADGFMTSLIASGGVKKTGPADTDFSLTKSGRKSRFLIGGDCFDKGPSSLRLLRMVRMLARRGARVHILAGNHDIRMLLGMRSLQLLPDPRTEHFFVRMGPKAVPFLSEINEEYLQGRDALRAVPSARECRRLLFPAKRWFREFPQHARWSMHDGALEREIQRMQKKMSGFEQHCNEAGLSLRRVYAAAMKWQQLFMHPKGEFYWFFRDMEVAHREGSFLFLHAGLDDRIATMIGEEGVAYLNKQFHTQLQKDIFDFYYGPMANTIRTKYREVDMPLTRRGVKRIHKKGIHAIVHGHVNLSHGQRIMLRKGMLNFECDASIDSGTRKKEGLKGPGAAVTIFHREGFVMGISTDYPYIKVFEPESFIHQPTGQGKVLTPS